MSLRRGVSLSTDASVRVAAHATTGRRIWRIVLLAAVPVAVALYFGIVLGVFAERLSLGVSALILGLPLAIVAGLIIGRVSSQSAAAIQEGSGLVRVREALVSLEAQVNPDEPERVEIIHPRLDLDGSATDVAVLNLARRLAERGHRPRLVLLEDDHLPHNWREHLAANPWIGPAIRDLEVISGTEDASLAFNPADRIIATDWSSAHTADRLCLDLPRTRFTYLIHEYQPFQYPMGTFAALADASYELSHRAIFLDRLLREYFSDQRLGVFATGPRLGLRETATFSEPILPVKPRTEAEMAGTDRHRLLIFARPEEDGSGNLYELAVMALDRAVLNGHFRGWDLAAIGTGAGDTTIVLPRSSARLRMLPEEPPAARASTLARFDVGMALRYAPGLGPVPVELAAAGMSVVTSTFAGKDAATLNGISPNLIPAGPRVDSIAPALGEAERRTHDHEGRVEGSRVSQPTSWDEALDDDVMAAIETLTARP